MFWVRCRRRRRKRRRRGRIRRPASRPASGFDPLLLLLHLTQNIALAKGQNPPK